MKNKKAKILSALKSRNAMQKESSDFFMNDKKTKKRLKHDGIYALSMKKILEGNLILINAVIDSFGEKAMVASDLMSCTINGVEYELKLSDLAHDKNT